MNSHRDIRPLRMILNHWLIVARDPPDRWAILVWFALVFMGGGATKATEIRVQTISGESIVGTLERLNADELVCHNADGEHSISVGNLVSVQRAIEPAVEDVDDLSNSHYLALADGSFVPVNSFQQEGSRIEARSARLGSFKLRTDQVDSVRLYPPGSKQDNEWQAIIDQEHAEDVIVIRKSENRLLFLEGIIDSVAEETLEFEFEGELTPVPAEKLEGWIYSHRLATDQPGSNCTLTTVHGARLNVANLQATSGTIQVRLPTGPEFSIRWSEVREIRFAAENQLFLSDLEPIAIEIRPRVGGGKLQSNLLRLMYQPQFDQSLHGKPLSLTMESGRRPTSFPKGLALHSQTRVTFRLPDRFDRLAGWAGIDPNVGSLGSVQLSILINDNVYFDQTIEGGQPAIPLEVDLGGATRLTILADYADDSDVGDYLNLCDLKVTK